MMLFVLAAAAALQAAGSPVDASLPAPASGADQKKVCRSEAVIGSRFDKKTCHTKAEWKMVDEENARAGRAYNNGGRDGMQAQPSNQR